MVAFICKIVSYPIVALVSPKGTYTAFVVLVILICKYIKTNYY